MRCTKMYKLPNKMVRSNPILNHFLVQVKHISFLSVTICPSSEFRVGISKGSDISD